MKKCSMIPLLALFVSCYAAAMMCPEVSAFDPTHPPPGWSLLLPPFDDTPYAYHFSSAIHSLNGSFYYKYIICEYETCLGCPKYEIISDTPYEMPNSNAAPWHGRPVIAHTLICSPPRHEPSQCEFA